MRLRVPMLLVGAALAALLLAMAWVDEGEVVVLTSVDADGHGGEKHVWVVEIDGDLYVRLYRPGPAWLERVREHARVQLTRGGVTRDVLLYGVKDAGVRDAVDRAMVAKYRWLERWHQRLHRRGSGVVVRLDPRAAPP